MKMTKKQIAKQVTYFIGLVCDEMAKGYECCRHGEKPKEGTSERVISIEASLAYWIEMYYGHNPERVW